MVEPPRQIEPPGTGIAVEGAYPVARRSCVGMRNALSGELVRGRQIIGDRYELSRTIRGRTAWGRSTWDTTSAWIARSMSKAHAVAFRRARRYGIRLALEPLPQIGVDARQRWKYLQGDHAR